MRKKILVVVTLLFCAALHADWAYLRDFDRGETPNEVHDNIKVHLTTENVRPGHVGFSIHPQGRGWVTRYNMWHNWTWYDRVAFHMHNANEVPVKVQFEVRTRHKRRGTIDFTVKPGPNDVVLRFADFKNIAEKPFLLWDVSQWVLFFADALDKPVTISEFRLVRENIQLPRPTEGAMGKSWKADGATLAAEKEKADPVPVLRAKVTFPAGKTSTVWLELRPSEKKFNTFTLVSNWLGYKRLTFTCDSPQKQAVAFDVLLEDFTTYACRDTEFRKGQVFVVPLKAGPGRHSMSVDLTALKTADGLRWFDPTQVHRIGFRVKDAKAATTLRFSDLCVRTDDESAGILVPKEGAKRCVRCGERLDDRNANCCPFCGKFYNPHAVVTPPTKNSVTLVPVKDASVMASSGGGQPTVNKPHKRSGGLNVCHYDISFWEGRTFLRFDPSSIKQDPAKIAKAELRLASRIAGKQGKSWLCPIRVFVAPDGRDDFDEEALSWITQPPIGAFASQGGLYAYWTERTAIDLTDFLKRRLAKSRKPFTLILRAFEATPCKADAHLFGHHLPFYSKDQPEEGKRPQLYIEFK